MSRPTRSGSPHGRRLRWRWFEHASDREPPVSRSPRFAGLPLAPAAHPHDHARVAASVSQCPDLLEQRLGRPALANASVQVSAQRRLELFCPCIEHAGLRSLGVLRFGHTVLAQPLPRGVPRQSRAPAHLADGQPISQVHPPDLGQHAHADHSCVSLLVHRAGQCVCAGQFFSDRQQARQ